MNSSRVSEHSRDLMFLKSVQQAAPGNLCDSEKDKMNLLLSRIYMPKFLQMLERLCCTYLLLYTTLRSINAVVLFLKMARRWLCRMSSALSSLTIHHIFRELHHSS